MKKVMNAIVSVVLRGAVIFGLLFLAYRLGMPMLQKVLPTFLYSLLKLALPFVLLILVLKNMRQVFDLFSYIFSPLFSLLPPAPPMEWVWEYDHAYASVSAHSDGMAVFYPLGEFASEQWKCRKCGVLNELKVDEMDIYPLEKNTFRVEYMDNTQDKPLFRSADVPADLFIREKLTCRTCGCVNNDPF